MTQPPHLPSKYSSIKQRRIIETLPWLLIYTVMAGVIATSISTAFLAWYVPDFVSYYVPARISNAENSSMQGGIDPLLEKYIDERTVTIYRGVEQENVVLNASDRIAQGIILSSDGWIAMVLETPLTEETVVLSAEGTLHSITSVIQDPVSGITYAKVIGANFLVSSLATEQASISETQVWTMNQQGIVNDRVSERRVVQSPLRMQLDMPYTSIIVSADDGSIMFNDSGAVLGFAKDGILIPSWYVTHALSSVLAGTPIDMARSGYQGTLVEAYIDPLTGIYFESLAIQITSVPVDKTNEMPLLVGDIITSVDAKPIDTHSFAEYWTNQKNITVRILRNNEYQNVELIP